MKTAAQKFFQISSYKTASRCWVPINQGLSVGNATAMRSFSSRQRCINFNTINDASVVSNDDILITSVEEAKKSAGDFGSFEPTVHSSEEIYTAAPVNKA